MLQVVGWILYITVLITLFVFTGSVMYFAFIQICWIITFLIRGEEYAEEYMDCYKRGAVEILIIGIVSLIISFSLEYSLQNHNYDIDFKRYGIQLNGYKR